jgi:multiple sugar transport system permease protein
MFVWNEYLFALILTFSRATTMPILIAGQDTARGPQWWYISSLSVLTILPVIMIGLFVERYLVKGLTRGGIK